MRRDDTSSAFDLAHRLAARRRACLAEHADGTIPQDSPPQPQSRHEYITFSLGRKCMRMIRMVLATNISPSEAGH